MGEEVLAEGQSASRSMGILRRDPVIRLVCYCEHCSWSVHKLCNTADTGNLLPGAIVMLYRSTGWPPDEIMKMYLNDFDL